MGADEEIRGQMQSEKSILQKEKNLKQMLLKRKEIDLIKWEDDCQEWKKIHPNNQEILIRESMQRVK